ncbi:MAG: tRNA pseudouridine(38-40) synthase TruA [Thermoflexia bacterium]|nr:MAG: tRNA pseudouridine(38-40) synthase TruA [Thermoflexia bacterium]
MWVRAIVAYDGTDYEGFQRQPNRRTVQGVLEDALEQVTGRRTTILAAGRTDTGVHAEGQVIAFDVDWGHALGELRDALNAVLPPDIAIRAVERVPPDFHPRYDAISRRYRYTLYNHPVRSPLARRYSLHVARPLNLAAMQAAAALLVGTHDFAAFGRPPKGTNAVRHVFQAHWQAQWPWLYFDIEADAFLYRMVRTLVGTMIRVGLGRLTVDDFREILLSRNPRLAGPAVPARGLCLVEVKYD